MAYFDGKVVIVTGGALGIGAGAAMEFAREGANVAIADVNLQAAQGVVQQLNDIGPRGIAVRADVSIAEDCKRVVAETVSRFGGLDILFNNAGVQPPESYTNVENTPEEVWDRILAVNLTVCPGGVDTPIWRSGKDEAGVEEALQRSGRTHPIGRIGLPRDIANVVVFLASDKASFMTGEMFAWTAA